MTMSWVSTRTMRIRFSPAFSPASENFLIAHLVATLPLVGHSRPVSFAGKSSAIPSSTVSASNLASGPLSGAADWSPTGARLAQPKALYQHRDGRRNLVKWLEIKQSHILF